MEIIKQGFTLTEDSNSETISPFASDYCYGGGCSANYCAHNSIPCPANGYPVCFCLFMP